jgi:nucleoside-diphosphate-sugar epimerase
MRVFVAGASGALGTSLLSALDAAGHTAVTSDADPSQRSAFLSSLDEVRADAVINLLAASTEVPAGYRELASVNRLRIEGTSTMLAAAKMLGATRYVATSCYYGYGFGDHGDQPVDERASFAETSDTRNDPVFRALRSSEQQARAAGAIVLRLAHLYGADARVIPPVSRRWAGSLPVIHVEDAARAAIRALDHGTAGEVYNIAAEEPSTWRVLQQVQARADGFAAPIALADSVMHRIAPFAAQIISGTSLRLSTAAALHDLDFTARHRTVDAAFGL